METIIVRRDLDFNPRPKSLIKGQHLTGKRKVYANLFPLKIFQSIKTLYTYVVRFEPEIEADFVYKKREIFNTIERKIGTEYGNFVFTGTNIYADKEVRDLKVIEAIYPKTGVKYQVSLAIHTETINLVNCDFKTTPAVKNIIEEIVRKILRSNVDLEFYRNLFVKKLKNNETSLIQSERHSVEFYPGYTTGVHYLNDGIFLCVALKNKILSTENCLIKIYNMERSTKDQIREFFIGRSVKTKYKKNNKNYLINDVSFDKNPGNMKFTNKGKDISMIDYYELVRGAKISDKKQPLFEVLSPNPQDGSQQAIYIVPELCVLSGLDDSMIEDRDFMTALAKETKMTPYERIKKTNDFKALLESKTGKKITIKGEKGESKEIELPSPAEVKSNFNLEISQPKEFEADYMKLPIITSNKRKIELNKNNGTFQFKQEAEDIENIVEWCCIYNKEDYSSAGKMLELMTKAAETFNIKVKEPTWIETYSTNAKDWTKEVETMLKNKPHKIFVFLLSRKTKRLYKEIKTNSLVTNGYLSQCILRENLSDKKGLSVCSNLVKQINSKLGGCCYQVQFDQEIKSKNLMVVGVDSSHISGKRTGVAMCASINKKMTRYTYYEQIIGEKTKNELCYAVANFLERALKEYYKVNKILPGGIVIYRQGVSAEQKLYLNDEVTQIQELLAGKVNKSILQDYKIPFNYILVNKKTNLKFFEKDGQNYKNSSPGLIIYDTAVNPKIHEFYIQPQFVNEGCATPTNYHVAYGDLDINEHIAQLTLGLCYNYANWQGPIRVPAPLKNAEKLSKLVAKFIKAELNPLLNNTQCYL